jgi:hypothetical protein
MKQTAGSGRTGAIASVVAGALAARYERTNST